MRFLGFGALCTAAAIACGVTAGEPIKPPVVAETCDAGSCGPPPAEPNYMCSNGSIGGPTGRCILNQDGTCGWELIACPPGSDSGPSSSADAGCSDADCGSRPLVPNIECGDGGANSGEQCVGVAGQCTWVWVPCN